MAAAHWWLWDGCGTGRPVGGASGIRDPLWPAMTVGATVGATGPTCDRVTVLKRVNRSPLVPSVCGTRGVLAFGLPALFPLAACRVSGGVGPRHGDRQERLWAQWRRIAAMATDGADFMCTATAALHSRRDRQRRLTTAIGRRISAKAGRGFQTCASKSAIVWRGTACPRC